MKNRLNLILISIATTIVAGIFIFKIITKDVSVEKEEKNNLVENVERYRYNRELGNYIGLDSLQQLLFKDLEFEYRKKLQNLRQELFTTEHQLIEALNSDENNKESLRKYSTEIGEIHTKIKDATIDHFFAVKEICNPEQQEKLQTLFSTFERKGFQQRGQGRRNRHNGMNRNMRGNRFNSEN